MNKQNSIIYVLISFITVVVTIALFANWSLEDIREILADILVKSIITMTVVWLILAASSTSILHRGRAPIIQTFTLFFLSIGGLGLAEIVSGGIPRGLLASMTIQWAGLTLGAGIVLFTILAVVTGGQEEEDPLLAMDK